MKFKKSTQNEITATLQLAWPIIISQLGAVLMGVTDNLMVANLLGEKSADGLAVSGLGNSLAFMMGSIAMGGFNVFSPQFSKLKAEKNYALMPRLFETAFVVAVLMTVFTTIKGILFYLFFDELGQDPRIEALSKEFYLIIMLSNIPFLYFVLARQVTDGLGHSRVAMVVTFLGLLMNALGNYVFILGNWGFPKLGIIGSAYATLLARTAMMFAMIWVLNKGEFRNKISYKLIKNRIFSIEQNMKAVFSSGFQFFFEIAAFSLAVVMMGWIGAHAMAAHQIAINIVSVTYMAATGLAAAGSIRCGRALGLKSKEQIILAGQVSLWMVTAFMTLMAALICIFYQQILDAYSAIPEVREIGFAMLMIGALFQISDGIQVVSLGLLRALFDTKFPTVITFIAYWVLALPIGYFLAFSFQCDAPGIWIGLLIGLSVCAIWLTIRFFKHINRLVL